MPPELRVQVTRSLRALEDRIGRQLYVTEKKLSRELYRTLTATMTTTAGTPNAA